MPFKSTANHTNNLINGANMSEMKTILSGLKDRVLIRVRKSKSQTLKNIYKRYSKYPTILSLERTFTTMMGLTLQEISEKCSTKLKVENTDVRKKKILGVDLRVFDGTTICEGQLKSHMNTQTGTHKGNSLEKLLDTTSKNKTSPFMAIAFSEPFDYTRDGIRYIGGSSFWDWIGVDHHELELNIEQTIKDCEDSIL